MADEQPFLGVIRCQVHEFTKQEQLSAGKSQVGSKQIQKMDKTGNGGINSILPNLRQKNFKNTLKNTILQFYL